MVGPVHCKYCALVLPGVRAFYDHCESSHGMTSEEASLQTLKPIEGELYDSEVQEPVKSSFWSGNGPKEKEIEDQIKEREEARQKGDYSYADMIRKNLLEENIIYL